MRIQHAPVPTLLLLALLALASGCATEQVVWTRDPGPPRAASAAGVDLQIARWRAEFVAIRAEAVPLLMAMADYSFYLPSVASATSLRTPDEFDWDPPNAPTWAELEPHLCPLNRRAALLHADASAAPQTLGDWRFRRAVAEGTHQLLLMAEYVQAYYAETAQLPSHQDGGATRHLLAAAYRYWGESEATWQQAMLLRDNAQRATP
ncbi:MAG: hypothetical protein HY690_20335 [Chloroflexi bacterium]|nr:hypothetical protein [Chloroflexota bacterium]